MHDNWLGYWLDQFVPLGLNTLILSIFCISMDLYAIYFAHFSECWASFVCSCHSTLDVHDADHTMMISDIATSACLIDFYHKAI